MSKDSTFKYVGLILLTLQQASMPLMARYTRFRSSDEVFFTTVNVFMMEITKLSVCSAILIYMARSVPRFVADVLGATIGSPIETVKVCVPALIYTLQNNLYYIALSHLEATTFCIAYQMKIFTTAIFMRTFLGKKLSTIQWGALFLLVAGVVDVQMVYSPPSGPSVAEQSPILGFSAVIAMCFTSALAGVFLEKVLKESKTNIWMQNVRLAIIGIPISLMSIWAYDWENIRNDGFFRGWDRWVVILTIVNSVGGLLISVVIKYADNILKAYAQSMAIVGAAVGSWILFDFLPDSQFALGALMVIASIIIYTRYPYTSQVAPFDMHKFSSSNSNLLMIKPTKGLSR